jgi:hypothetical protein
VLSGAKFKLKLAHTSKYALYQYQADRLPAACARFSRFESAGSRSLAGEAHRAVVVRTARQRLHACQPAAGLSGPRPPSSDRSVVVVVMRRSQVLAARDRQQQAAAAAASAAGGQAGAGVHAPAKMHATPAATSVVDGASDPESRSASLGALAAFPSTSTAASAPAAPAAEVRPLGKGNSDRAKKNTMRGERNARARTDTEVRRATKEGRQSSLEELTDLLSAGQAEEPMSDHERALKAELEDAEDPPVHLSSAKLAFLSTVQPGTIGSTAAEMVASAERAAAAGVSTAAQPSSRPVTPPPFTTVKPPPLPAFSPARKGFTAPRGSGVALVQKTKPGSGSGGGGAASSANAATDKPERYYSVNFAARSSKKHKTWDDGILIVCGRRCVLKNMGAQQLGSQLVPFSTDKIEIGSVRAREHTAGYPRPC